MKWTKKRKEEMHQLSNDIAENMNMRHWKRKDLIDAVTYYADLAANEAQKRCALLSTVQLGLTKLVIEVAEESNRKYDDEG